MKLTMISLSLITPLLKHPISLGSTLLMQTTLITSMMYFESFTSWYSYILFITVIGGMMVMFMYMSSIASNEKFNSMNKKFIILIILLSMILQTYMILKIEFKTNFEQKKFYFSEMDQLKSNSKFFNSKKNMFTIIIMLILFLTMISVSIIASSHEGPLKKTYV